MARRSSGCGCVLAVLALVLGAGYFAGRKYFLPWWKNKPPPPSGAQLEIDVLDVGPGEGDSILIISPSGNVVLVDAGDVGKGKAVLKSLQKHHVDHIDLFIATHEHPDHIGGAPEVFKVIKPRMVLYSGAPPEEAAPFDDESSTNANQRATRKRTTIKQSKTVELPTTKALENLKAAASDSGAEFDTADAGHKYDLGGGAMITLLGPTQPFFTREQMRSGGNVPNANSIVARLDYGSFSMLLAGDAEAQTEGRLLGLDVDLRATVLKVAHHGSKYATSEDFLKRVHPEAAVISDGAYNHYGHPSQAVLDRLRAAGVRVYRTDLQGEISITTKGRGYDIHPEKSAGTDLMNGRDPQKDDSTKSGFIGYGDFGPPPKPQGNSRSK